MEFIFVTISTVFFENISQITTLMAVIIGPSFQLIIANRQLKAQTHSINRQAWIIELRSVVSELCSNLSSIMHYLITKGEPNIITEKMMYERISKIENLIFLSHKLKLMLNPNEKEHKLLIETANDLIINLNDYQKKIEETESMEFNETILNIISITQRILKFEWERVKNLK